MSYKEYFKVISSDSCKGVWFINDGEHVYGWFDYYMDPKPKNYKDMWRLDQMAKHSEPSDNGIKDLKALYYECVFDEILNGL